MNPQRSLSEVRKVFRGPLRALRSPLRASIRPVGTLTSSLRAYGAQGPINALRGLSNALRGFIRAFNIPTQALRRLKKAL